MAISSLSSISVLRAAREVTGANDLAKKAKSSEAATQTSREAVSTSKISNALSSAYNSKGAYRITPIDVTKADMVSMFKLARAIKTPPMTTDPITPTKGTPVQLPPVADIETMPIQTKGKAAYDQPGGRTPATPEDAPVSGSVRIDRKLIVDSGPIQIDLGDGMYKLDPVPLPPTSVDVGADVVRGKFKPIAQLPPVDEARGPKQPIKVPPIPEPPQAVTDISEQPISLYPVNELA